MANEQQDRERTGLENRNNATSANHPVNSPFDDLDDFSREEDEVLNKGEITNNDGSIVETLDTAFHNTPGVIKDHSLAGSNRADFYEARSDGKSDSEEELEVLRKQHSK